MTAMLRLIAVSLFLNSMASAALTRVPNTTLTLPPEPPTVGFAFTNAFPGLTVSAPMAFAAAPGETNRLFIVERSGRIIVVTNLAAPNRTLFLDISATTLTGGEEGLLGLAFHPGFATNRYFFVFYSVSTTTTAGTGRHQRVARFEVSPTNPNAAMPSTLTRIIDQYDEASNHNAGDIHFGPDGYLYIAVGDEGGGNDQYNNSQTITKDLHAGILRIDVDKRAGNLQPNPHSASTSNYLVPADNPFVGATTFNGVAVDPAKVRTEFWAVGLRNPWRMSFDVPTGTLYCADVGQGRWEEVNVIVRGGNYGWAYREGTSTGPKAAPAGFTSIPPIHQYAHCSTCASDLQAGNSITGGLLYRGTRLSQLFGKYVFADYVSGHVWALSPDAMNPVSKQYLLTDTGIVAFGRDPRNGDILAADITETQIKRLVYSSSSGTPLPPTLADTGAFADLSTLTPQPGIVPYEINTPFWSDGASKQRWFSIPDVSRTMKFDRDGNWTFPVGTVWIKHFELQLTNGVPESTQRLETRFLVRTTNGMYGMTYRWGESGNNASLVAEQGLDEPFAVNEGGIVRTQVWHYPSRSECLACHTSQGGLALGFNTAQLNRDQNYAGIVTNQIAALSQAGYFQTPPTEIHTLPFMSPAADTRVSLERRVRSYLAANCVQCHQPGGPAPSNWDARLTTPTQLAGLIEAVPRDNGGNPEARIVKPGSPEDSVLLSRITTLGPGRMPPLASSVLDAEAITLLSQWITNDLPAYRSFPQWQTERFGSPLPANAASDADADGDGARNYLEYLTDTNPLDAADAWKISASRTGSFPAIVFPQVANRAFQVQVSQTIPPVWTPLDVAGNEPFFWATNRPGFVLHPTNSSPLFYRVKVMEP